MKEIPILFSQQMVQAILAGNKTMTRRVIKAPVLYKVNKEPDKITHIKDVWDFRWNGNIVGGGFDLKCPYGQPGDRLWVRETFRESFNHAATQWEYRVDTPRETDAQTPFNWSPSIHMPKAAARIWLEVVSVRVERLQEITREDAIAEGVDWKTCPTYQTPNQTLNMIKGYGCSVTIDYIGGFRALWDSINAKRGYGWDVNPYVWVVEFKRLEVPS